MLKTIVAVLFTVAVPATSQAQGTSEQRSACMGDAFRFCVSDIPNVPAIEACLAINRTSLTPACQAEFSPATRTRIESSHFR